MRTLLKRLLRGVSLIAAFPAAALCGFGRWRVLFRMFAHAASLMPGLPGDYLRIAYYRLTLRRCGRTSRIEFGSFFSQPEASLGERVYIGSYCVLGRARIGDRTQISSGVMLASGRSQHGRDAQGRLQSSDLDHFETLEIGADCWIGTGAIILAGVGERTTVGAGAVVAKPLPPDVTAVGVPARPLERE